MCYSYCLDSLLTWWLNQLRFCTYLLGYRWFFKKQKRYRFKHVQQNWRKDDFTTSLHQYLMAFHLSSWIQPLWNNIRQQKPAIRSSLAYMTHQDFFDTIQTESYRVILIWPCLGKISFLDTFFLHLYGFIISRIHRFTKLINEITAYLFYWGLGLLIMKRGFFLTGYLAGDFLLYFL